MKSRRYLLAAACQIVLAAASAAAAQSVAYNAPNTVSTLDAVTVTLNGSSFVNQGLVGTARLPANLRDFNGETLGSFSGMAIDLKTWRRATNGSYTATMFTLPDRGPNNIGGLTTTNYAARLNKFSLTLNPYTGTTALASNVQQMQMTQSGGFLLKDATGQTFTGRDPQSGVVVRNGISYPTPPAGDPGFGKISFDAEAVTLLRDGSFYVGDEYGAMILYFDNTGKQLGAIQANPDLLPRVNGAINFNGTNDAPLIAGTTGRRSNQGMEGISVSPDGKRLFAVLQSAPLQDNPTNVAVRRNNTRVLVYDISGTRTPTAPMAEYVLQLPVFNNSATGIGAATATAAQSEVLALNNTQFLVLSRDGNGRGTNGNANAIAFKSVLLVDLAGATNIAGTPYSGTTPISTSAAANGSGALVPGIVPVQQVELVNMLNTAQLAKFGINTNTRPSVQHTLSEKWEAMGLAPVLEENRPHDFFLLIGNDNDFVSADINAAGVTNANAALNSLTAGVGDNDNVVLIYRLTLPTYIDPEALAYVTTAAPHAMTGARSIGAQIGATSTLAGGASLAFARRAKAAGSDISGLRGWGQADYGRLGMPGDLGTADGGDFTVGIEAGSDMFRYGFALASANYQTDDSEEFTFDGKANSASIYAGLFHPQGFYAQAALGAGTLEMDVSRPAAYGLRAKGLAEGQSFSVSGQFGYSLAADGVRYTPYLDLTHTHASLGAYTEHGAAVGNGDIPRSRYGRTEATLGLEVALSPWGGVRPSGRLGYTVVEETGDSDARLGIAGVEGSFSRVRLQTYSKPFIGAEAALEGDWHGFGWRAAVAARDTDHETSGQVSLGLSKRF